MHARTIQPHNQTIAEYLRTYVVNFGGIMHTPLTNI
jgi:hypothetical protein